MEEGWEEASVHAYRLLLIVGAVVMIPFGFLLRMAMPDAVDPMLFRVLFAGVMAGLAGLSFYRKGRPLVLRGSIVVEVLLVLWFCALALANGTHLLYLMGLYFLVMVTALINGLSAENFRTHFAFSAYALAACIVVTAFGASPWAERLLFLAIVVFTLLLNKVIVVVRLRITEGLRRGQAHFEEAQRVASLASWEYNEQTDTLRWSDEAFRLLGYAPGAVEPSWGAARARIHAGDVKRARVALGRMLASEKRQRVRVRISQPDGSVRYVDIVGVPERVPGGKLRLFGVALDMTDQVRRDQAQEYQAAELRAARDRAEELARLKDAFLANMSHEIRTPLTAIIGFSELLADEVPEASRDFALRIENGGRRLLETLNSVLDLARLEADQVTLTPSAVPLHREVVEVARLYEQRAARKNVGLRVYVPENLHVWADRAALHRVVTNLLSNAVKFTERGTITVYTESVADPGPPRLRLCISDTGPGIDPRFLPRLFNEFEQASSGQSRTHEGSGLGLAITRRLIRLMDTEIEVESQIGEGTTFTVTLPTYQPLHGVARLEAAHVGGDGAAGEPTS